MDEFEWPDRYLTADQVAELLHVKQKTLANWRNQGIGPKHLPRRPVLYSASAIKKYLAETAGKIDP